MSCRLTKQIILRVGFSILYLSSLSLHAQGNLWGTVTEKEPSQPLPGAHVLLQNVGQGTITNQNGTFRFTNLPAGFYKVEVSFIGFCPSIQYVEIIDRQNTTLNINLAPGKINLGDLVISAAAEKPLNTLATIDIKLRPTNSSQDILRLVPGLFIAQHAGGGKADQIFLRGFDIDHGTDINLEVDGVPVNMVSHAHGQGYSDLHFLLPELISMVDFDKGPYYASKGDFTTAGYVRFQTRNLLDKNFIRQEGGQFGTTRTVAGINIDKNGYIASEYSRSDGYFESPQKFNRFNITSKYGVPVGKNDRAIFGATYFTSHWNASGQVPERAVNDGTITRFGSIDNSEGGITSRLNLFANLQHHFDGPATIEQQLYSVLYDFNLYSNFTFFLRDPVNGDQIQQMESRKIYGYKAIYNTSGLVLGKDLKTEMGVGFRFDNLTGIGLSHTVKRKILNAEQQGNLREGNFNGYFSETLTFNSYWSAEAGLRFDYFTFSYADKLRNTKKSESASIISPKFNINCRLNKFIQFYAKAGFGFHSNDARVVVSQNGKQILPHAFGVDVGIHVKPSQRFLLNSALWQLNLDQEFVYIGDEGIVEPSGKTQRQGIDLSIRYQLLPWLFADADMNATIPRSIGSPEGQDYIPLAPTFTSMGGFSVKNKDGLSGSLRYRYMANRPANEDKSVVAEGYFLTDAVVNYTSPKYEFSLSVENLFNAKWKEAQFDTESKLHNESQAVSEIHFTPGTPLFIKLKVSYFF